MCCKSSPNGTCVPYDIKSPMLPDGVLCYRGICEKGRCEQPIQDVVERLWDIIEDITVSTFVKFLRDNIIIVVLVLSIPIWCLATHFITAWDRRVRYDVVRELQRRKGPNIHKPCPWQPTVFVGNPEQDFPSSEDISGSNANLPYMNKHNSYLREPEQTGETQFSQSTIEQDPVFTIDRPVVGFKPPHAGFQLEGSL